MADTRCLSLVVLTVLLCAQANAGPSDYIRSYVNQRVEFELFSRANPDTPEQILIDGNAEVPKNFDPNRPTKVMVHGWMSHGRWMVEMKDDFLQQEDLNVILVRWRAADTVLYFVTRMLVEPIGQRVAHLIDFLDENFRIDPSDVHMIGHSLGAHISGMAAKVTKAGMVGRITGLDPAGPLFGAKAAHRLDKAYALFVDVIHTCTTTLGFSNPIGHVDFYPNGGRCWQPGCSLSNIHNAKDAVSCSHNRSCLYFRESILNQKTFKAWPCNGGGDVPHEGEGEFSYMGLDVQQTTRGNYCLRTNSSSPFGLNA